MNQPAEDTAAASVKKPSRRWLQFSLRTLLLVVVPVACVFAWLGAEYRRGHRQHEAIAWVEKQGGRVEFDDALTQANWQRQWFGDWYPNSVVKVEFVRFRYPLGAPPDYKMPRHTLGNLAPLEELKDLRVLLLEDCDFESVAPLATLPNLRELRMSGSSAEDLRPLAELESLDVFDLSSLPAYKDSSYWCPAPAKVRGAFSANSRPQLHRESAVSEQV